MKVLSKIRGKLFRVIWRVFVKIPKLRESIYRFYAWRIFEIVPYFKSFIYKLYDKFWYLELFLENEDFKPSIYQSNEYDINLTRINYTLRDRDRPETTMASDWDLNENLIKIEDTIEYHLLKDRFLNKLDWKSSPFYEVITQKISSGHEIVNCSNEDQFFKYLLSLDFLFDNLEQKKGEQPLQNIKVGIGRDGKYILLDHVFIISLLKLLRYEEIPIHVTIRHPSWLKFSGEFLKYQSIHGGLYQPLIHPDLKYKSSYSDRRFCTIKENLSIHHGTLLDIGANLGYFCHKFEELGFSCYAVEIRPSNVYYMKKLRDIEGKKFKVINKSIFDLTEKLDFDIVLALNIFHHFLREKSLYDNLITFLKSLRVKEMYFQPHDPGEKIMRNAYMNYDNEQFVNFIIEHSCLNKYQIIDDQTEGNRPLYKLLL
jgi:hypothetical protein